MNEIPRGNDFKHDNCSYHVYHLFFLRMFRFNTWNCDRYLWKRLVTCFNASYLMKPTIWARNQNNLQPESDIKVWLNFSYYQGKISGTEMVHLFLYISPLVTKHYKTIIPPKTNIDTKMMVSKSPFPGGPQFQVPAVKFSCSFCMFDSRGIGSLFLGTNFEFFISVLLLVRRVWLVVFGYGGLKIDNISISHEVSFFWAVPAQKTEGQWLVNG